MSRPIPRLGGHRKGRGPVTLAALSLAAFLLAACGSSGPTAAQQVCSDRSQLSSAVSSVANDLRSGNLSKAKDDLPAVHDAFDSLTKSIEQLATEQRQSLSPKIDELKSSVSGLKNSDSLSSLTTDLRSVRSQVQSISQQVEDGLHCS
jgi:uncharacterized phage infection (PIP) family protein YhgE